MHRSSKRIVGPLFLLLVAAAIFVPEVRGDGIPMLNFTFGGSSGGDTLFFTLPQNPVPDFVTTEPGFNGFGFSLVPVIASFMPPNTPITYSVEFFRQSDSTSFEMGCNPFRFSPIEPPFFHCDEITRVDIPGLTAMWSGPLDNPTFIPGVYGDLTISATPEPSTLALLLMSFATLSLLAAGVRPNHR